MFSIAFNMKPLIISFILCFISLNNNAQNPHDYELNQLWDKVEYYQKTNNIEKIIENKLKLVELYRSYYPNDLPMMLRNIAITCDTLPSPYNEKSEAFFKESLNLFSKKDKTDENVQYFYDCFVDYISGIYNKKNYDAMLQKIVDLEEFFNNPLTSNQQDYYINKNNIKYNSIALIVDSCETLLKNNNYEKAYNFIQLPVKIIEPQMRNNIYIPEINNLCLRVIWDYAETLDFLGKKQESIEIRNLHNKYIRENLNLYDTIGGISAKEYLWIMERTVALKYGELGNIEKDIEISSNIVDEARAYNDSILLAKKIEDLAVSYSTTHSLEGRRKAQSCYEEALNILMKTNQSKEVVDLELKIIGLLASEYVLCSDYNKAYTFFKQYDEFIREHDTKEEEDIILSVLEWKASTYHHLDFPDTTQEEAINIQKRKLKKIEEKEGKNNANYLSAYRMLILFYSGSKYTSERVQYLKEGMDIWDEIDKKEQYPEYASFLNTLFVEVCGIETIDSDYSKLIEKELINISDNYNPDFHTKLNFYLSASLAYYNNLDTDKALKYIEKAKEICLVHMDLSEIRERYAEIITQEANIQYRLNDINKADELANEAFKIFSELGNENLRLSQSLNSLASVKGEIGDRKKAFELAFESLKIQLRLDPNKITPDDIIAPLRYANADEIIEALKKTINNPYYNNFPSVVNMYLMLANAYSIKGDDYRSEQYCNLAETFLNVHKDNNYFKNNKKYNVVKKDILYNRALRHLKKTEYDKAAVLLDTINQITGVTYMDLPFVYAHLGNKDKFIKYSNILFNSIKSELELHFIFLSEHEKEMYMQEYMQFNLENLESYPSIINIDEAREIAFNSVLMHKGIVLESSKNIKKNISNYDEIKTLYDNTQKLKEQQVHVEDSISRYKIQQRIDENEKTIQRYIINNSNLQESLLYSWKDVKASLTEDDIVVEFIQIPMIDWEQYSPIQDIKFAALLLTKNSNSPEFIELCNESQIKELKSEEYDIYRKEKALEAYEIIWGKIDTSLSRYKNIYFSPIGIFNVINVEQLAQNKYNNKSFIRLTSSRELCKRNEFSRRISSAVIFGNLNYNTQIKNKTQKDIFFNNKAALYIQRSNAEIGEIIPLTGTKNEIENICSLIKSHKLEYICYDGDNGTEEIFKALNTLDNISILHIATHGFSLGHSTVKDYDDPMRKCGLLLSGCQDAWLGKNTNNHEDGILLGEEIQNIELNNNDIVILSACETGLGKISSEGVYGLQRAFKKSGAGSIMMSLWKVNDIATSLIINEFYKYYLAGSKKQESLKKAQEYVRNYVDEDGNKLFEDPYYWAGFILLDAIE